ncbi:MULTISPECIES: hypothetical protein [Klebsiella pneumoniae complex]|jgi:hypothetical protein|uniref:hypothetical protein n=1 Tax=Klebsiella pneumoniae complex TaxID=3390273 RepID=UPI00101D3AD9|nr:MULTISPECIES: hypothetical protein [Klebsiella]MCS4374495.1 hypothetical protein [Klebsiella quasipneumoniae subsp. similipneumoniae]MCS4418668.1 hypothetical protein [Klebsiella quasipneumoniae subsp. similipneumoniae]RYI36871.1 hypothetical protein EVY37_27975 [Klebsiella pneumoniae]HBS6700429.1 hypothetical protein [Klebsiella pneumoniae]HBS7246694.1 hypothetical protein [Klebsiella pneumoniae]
MGKKIRIAGLDPSLSNFGISVGTLDIETNKVDIEKFYLVETSAGGSKKQVRVNSDDLRRANEIWRTLKPVIDDAQLIFAELPVGSQSSRAQTSYGICLGVLACINKPLIQLTPTEIKQYVGGKKDTSKAEIIEWVVSQQPNAPWLKKKTKGVETLVNKNEHLADSVAAIYTGLTTDQYQNAANMMRSFAS